MSGAIYILSDTHLGHQLVSGLRGFRTTQEHDDRIRREWEKRVRDRDTVYILGDISSGTTVGQEYALEFIDSLPGHKRLILGNHDSAHDMHGNKAVKWAARYRKVFEHVTLEARLNWQGHRIHLSHFPYARALTGIGYEDRYFDWRPVFTTELLLHGHTHQGHVRTSQHEISVGLDAWKMRPVNIGEIWAEYQKPFVPLIV